MLSTLNDSPNGRKMEINTLAFRFIDAASEDAPVFAR